MFAFVVCALLECVSNSSAPHSMSQYVCPLEGCGCSFASAADSCSLLYTLLLLHPTSSSIHIPTLHFPGHYLYQITLLLLRHLINITLPQYILISMHQNSLLIPIRRQDLRQDSFPPSMLLFFPTVRYHSFSRVAVPTDLPTIFQLRMRCRQASPGRADGGQ